MDITHLGPQLIFYFDVFVEFVLCIFFYCSFYILELVCKKFTGFSGKCLGMKLEKMSRDEISERPRR